MTDNDSPFGDPYVRCSIAVDVERDGSWYPGVALAYWGDRVHVRYNVGVGMNHQETVPADRVRRPAA